MHKETISESDSVTNGKKKTIQRLSNTSLDRLSSTDCYVSASDQLIDELLRLNIGIRELRQCTGPRVDLGGAVIDEDPSFSAKHLLEGSALTILRNENQTGSRNSMRRERACSYLQPEALAEEIHDGARVRGAFLFLVNRADFSRRVQLTNPLPVFVRNLGVAFHS